MNFQRRDNILGALSFSDPGNIVAYSLLKGSDFPKNNRTTASKKSWKTPYLMGMKWSVLEK